MAQNHYEQLGVKPDASTDDIKKAYRKIAIENHPDKLQNKYPKDSPEYNAGVRKFKDATDAHDVLTDPDKRAKYDRQTNAGRSSDARQNTKQKEEPRRPREEAKPKEEPKKQKPGPEAKADARENPGQKEAPGNSRKGPDAHADAHEAAGHAEQTKNSSKKTGPKPEAPGNSRSSSGAHKPSAPHTEPHVSRPASAAPKPPSTHVDVPKSTGGGRFTARAAKMGGIIGTLVGVIQTSGEVKDIMSSDMSAAEKAEAMGDIAGAIVLDGAAGYATLGLSGSAVSTYALGKKELFKETVGLMAQMDALEKDYASGKISEAEYKARDNNFTKRMEDINARGDALLGQAALNTAPGYIIQAPMLMYETAGLYSQVEESLKANPEFNKFLRFKAHTLTVEDLPESHPYRKSVERGETTFDPGKLDFSQPQNIAILRNAIYKDLEAAQQKMDANDGVFPSWVPFQDQQRIMRYEDAHRDQMENNAALTELDHFAAKARNGQATSLGILPSDLKEMATIRSYLAERVGQTIPPEQLEAHYSKVERLITLSHASKFGLSNSMREKIDADIAQLSPILSEERRQALSERMGIDLPGKPVVHPVLVKGNPTIEEPSVMPPAPQEITPPAASEPAAVAVVPNAPSAVQQTPSQQPIPAVKPLPPVAEAGPIQSPASPPIAGAGEFFGEKTPVPERDPITEMNRDLNAKFSAMRVDPDNISKRIAFNTAYGAALSHYAGKDGNLDMSGPEAQKFRADFELAMGGGEAGREAADAIDREFRSGHKQFVIDALAGATPEQKNKIAQEFSATLDQNFNGQVDSDKVAALQDKLLKGGMSGGDVKSTMEQIDKALAGVDRLNVGAYAEVQGLPEGRQNSSAPVPKPDPAQLAKR